MAVILFHMGYLINGYLGVDIFFVISGFLIINIIYQESKINAFTIFNFYIRRIRRIIPLVLFISITALIIGIFVMLPDDLENLSESVIATNFFANNILLLITTVNYWSIVNEFKPLMHTWSLGVEEQFYLIIPFLFIAFKNKLNSPILFILIIFSILSFTAFIFSNNNAHTFYLLQFRFFELSFGGIGAILSNKIKVKSSLSTLLLFSILFILFVNISIPSKLLTVLIVILTIGILITPNPNKINKLLLENKFMLYVGLISFSLYMWHQVILAYTKYCLNNTPNFLQYIFILIIIFILSIFTYKFIENPFRNKLVINNKKFIIITLSFFTLIISLSSYIYLNMGIVRNIPELDIYKYNLHRSVFGNISNDDNSYKKKYQIYNERVYSYNKNFISNEKYKILIIGNSFARDFANILLESNINDKIEISYTDNIKNCNDFTLKKEAANYILFDDLDYVDYKNNISNYNIDSSKIKIIGIKNFGMNNGVYYSRRFFNDYYAQKIVIKSSILQRNNDLKNIYKNSYIDLINVISDDKKKIPIFTPNHKFISHDGMHLTEAGSIFIATKLNLNSIFN